MHLTLEVVSPQAVSLGAQRRQIVGPSGLTIGRVEGNDWVIPDPYISRQHARISCANGGFTVEGLGKNPIAIDKPDNVIAARQPHVLKNGDHLFIDQYDILVTILQGEPSQAGRAVAGDDPFGIVDAGADSLASTEKPLLPSVCEEGPVGVIAGSALQLDPLEVLHGGAPPAVPEPAPVNLQPDSPLRDSLAPLLQRTGLSPPSEAAAIPRNWDEPPRPRTVVERPRVQPAMRLVTPQPEAARAAGPGEVGARTVLLSAAAAPAAAAVPAALPSATPPTLAPAALRYDPGSRLTEQSLTELLRSAGLSERDVSPAMMRELGQVLRIVVQGVMEVLHARTDIKAQFRLPQTRVQARENNPLKLSPNVESALHTLLVQRNGAYLATVPAFAEAFADIRNHQVALLEGVRVAFASMLEAFAPRQLLKEFDGVVKRGGPLAGLLYGKSKYWDLYVERFSALERDADDTFRRLFGDVFAQAYERQLERLKRLASQRDPG